MSPEEEQKIRSLLKIPASISSAEVASLYESVKDFLLAASSASNAKPLTEAALEKLYSSEGTKSQPKASQSSQTTASTPDPTTKANSSDNTQPVNAHSTPTGSPIVEPSALTEPKQQQEILGLLQVANQTLPIAIFAVILITGFIAYNKFVTAPEAKRQQIEKQQQENNYKQNANAQIEAAKIADCDRIQASVAGNVDIQEQARQRRYEARRQADPNGLPLVPTISDLKRKLSAIDEKIKLLDGTNQIGIDGEISNLQNQIAVDQAEADRLNNNAGGVLYSPAAGRRSSYTEGYNEFHSLLLKIETAKFQINELNKLKQDPQTSLEQLKSQRMQVQLELGTN